MRITGTLLVALIASAALLPSAATAALRLNMESPTFVYTGQDQVVDLDVFLTDLDNSNEGLGAFTVALNLVTTNPNGVRFQPPATGPSPDHPYVFKDSPFPEDRAPVDFNSTPARIQAAGTIQAGGVDVTPTLNGLFKVPLFIPANATPGFYTFAFDASATSFSGVNGPLTVIHSAGAIFVPVVPEPSAAALVLVPMLAALRRRRRTPAA